MLRCIQLPWSPCCSSSYHGHGLLSSDFMQKSLSLVVVAPPSSPLVPCTRPPQASLLQSPTLWAFRTCFFYALLQLGVAGRPPQTSSSLQDEKDPEWPLNWFFRQDEEVRHAKELKRVRSRWQTTTKGTLKRRYRVPTKSEGRRLLNAISSLLSDDDTFLDATSHKGCQIRRENAHAESVCCHNVRALFDELPIPHLVVEITAFPDGPITNVHYEKAQKIEKLLRTGNSI